MDSCGNADMDIVAIANLANKNELTLKFNFTVRDGVALAIGTLMLIYWSFRIQQYRNPSLVYLCKK